jgi:hypothetical protein
MEITMNPDCMPKRWWKEDKDDFSFNDYIKDEITFDDDPLFQNQYLKHMQANYLDSIEPTWKHEKKKPPSIDDYIPEFERQNLHKKYFKPGDLVTEWSDPEPKKTIGLVVRTRVQLGPWPPETVKEAHDPWETEPMGVEILWPSGELEIRPEDELQLVEDTCKTSRDGV